MGQHEINIRYAGALTMADRHAIYKQCLKEVADQLGVSVTFMAKFATDQAGSSCHIHLSLWQREENIFPGDQPIGPVLGSDAFRWFLGGWIKHAPEFMVFYAPTINAYKRYQDGSWAPTRLAWSYDNRTAGFRVVGQGEALRTECRIPGGDANPYLAFAVILAAGLDGIERELEPPPIFEGNLYTAEDLPQVPRTLGDAIAEAEASEFLRKALGDDVLEHYLHFARTEKRKFDETVTTWERARFLERA
jgi:glutamine synthetase